MSKPIDTNGNPFTSYYTNGQGLTVSGTTAAQSAFEHTAIYVGTAGALAVQFATGGSEILFYAPAGALLPIQVAYVNSTNTTADEIVLVR